MRTSARYASPPKRNPTRAEVEQIANESDGGDPVAGWRRAVATLAKIVGNEAAARDRLLGCDAGSRLYQRAARVGAEAEAKRLRLPGGRRPLPAGL